MPAYRGKNLRSGDLAEQLGIFLLQSVALVAPVPRTEDVGIDVVATLIRSFDNYKYMAEDSFFVQIKSSSVTDCSFSDSQLNWLQELHLPLFIATVDKGTSSIKLYSTHSLSDAFVENPNRKEIKLKFLEDYNSDIVGSEENLELAIGPPVIIWSLNTLETNPDFLDFFHQLMKPHIALAKKSIETRRIGYVELATWQTNSLPKVYGSKMKRREDVDKVDEITAPYFHTILNNFMFGDDIATTRSVYRLLDKVLESRGHFHFFEGKKELIPWTAPFEAKLYNENK